MNLLTGQSSGRIDAAVGDLDAFADRLAAELAPRVAERVAEIIAEPLRPIAAHPPMSAAEVAKRLGRSRDWVYSHAEELGAIRVGEVGEGRRPALQFPAALIEALACGEAPTNGRPEAPPAPRRRRPSKKASELLPIRGRADFQTSAPNLKESSQ